MRLRPACIYIHNGIGGGKRVEIITLFSSVLLLPVRGGACVDCDASIFVAVVVVVVVVVVAA